MRIMAIGAGHFVLGDTMVGKLGKILSNIQMTLETKLRHIPGADLLLRALVKFMTIAATDVAGGVRAGIPILQVGSGNG